MSVLTCAGRGRKCSLQPTMERAVTAMMKRLLIASAALIYPCSAAFAQEAATGHRVRVGLGAQVRPEYVGADKSDIAPLFHVTIARGTDQFRFGAPDDSAGIAVVRKDGFSFGPAANIEGSRKDSDVGAP